MDFLRAEKTAVLISKLGHFYFTALFYISVYFLHLLLHLKWNEETPSSSNQWEGDLEVTLRVK